MQPAIIINGDDFGYSKGVNQGIRKAYEEGILTSTTALANGPALENTLQQLINTSGLPKPPLGIGVHLTLTFGQPLAPSLWNFSVFTRPYKLDVQKAWKGSAWQEYFAQFSEAQIEKEYEAQIEKVREIFTKLDHLDSHHGTTGYPPADKAYQAVAMKYKLAVRPLAYFSEQSIYGGDYIINTDAMANFRAKGIPTVDSEHMGYWHDKPDPVAVFLKDVETVKPGEVREYMFHPATDDSQGSWRMKDLQILTDKKVIAFIKTNGIQLTTYAKLR